MILPPTVQDDVTKRLRAHADEVHAPHPQYTGYFDTWVLGRVVTPTRFKGGSTLERGTLTLMSPHVREGEVPEVGATRSAYDWQTGHVVSMPAHAIVDVL